MHTQPPLLSRVVLFAAAVVAAVSSPSCGSDEELQATPGSLRGVVCSTPTGGTLGGVEVAIVDGRGKTTTTTSDAFGAYRGDRLAAGRGTVTVNEPNLVARRYDVEIDPLLEAEIIDATCHPPLPPPPAPGGTVTGCICDEALGAWVEAANVFVLTDGGGVVVTGTDAVGCFVLGGVPPGPQTVKVEKGAFFEQYDVVVTVDGTFALPAVETCAPTPPPPPGDVGSVEGRVCAPDGVTWLSAADASVTRSDGSRVGDQTDVDGRFRIDSVPVGDQVVNIVKGSFTSSIPVTIVSGQTTVIPEDECQLQAENLKIAVVTGDYDRVQDVLAGIGIQSTDVDTYQSSFSNSNWTVDLLGDRTLLFQYDIVFLNCGLGDLPFTARFFNTIPPETLQNLRDFVSQGGSVYASDWAYYVVEKTWPDFVGFRGDDSQGGSAKVGSAPQDLTANIVDAPMSLALGQATMELHYPLSAWVVIEEAAPSTTVYIRGSASLDDGTVLEDVPHTVAFRPGSGRVLFTSFHQEPGINPDMQRVLQLLIFEL